jgi:hypothetical protein
MQSPTVAFDESGNTGQDLLNPTQPQFVLASARFSPNEERELLSIFGRRQGELSFSGLHDRPRGRAQILDFLKSPSITNTNVKLAAAHKRFSVVTKIVDLLIEPLADERTVDLYARGQNIAMANVLYLCTPAICGAGLFDRWLGAFVAMIREKTNAAINDFYGTTRTMTRACDNEQFLCFLRLVTDTGANVRNALDQCDVTAIDPAVSLFVLHCNAWGNELGERFDILHDSSKPIASCRKELERLMDERVPTRVVGYDRRQMTLPLKAKGITFVNSALYPQVQLADVIAGAYAAVLGDPQADPELTTVVRERLDPCALSVIWPTRDVMIQDLGPQDAHGANIVDGIQSFLQAQRSLPQGSGGS